MMAYLEELFQLLGITAVVVVLGAVVCFYAFRSYRRTKQRSMAYLGTGFALISIGSALSWWAFWWMGWDPVDCQLGTVGVSTAGFVAIIYSLSSRAA